jgi:alkylation response protein AidB-like acyl-CoA dehydrogenase
VRLLGPTDAWAFRDELRAFLDERCPPEALGGLGRAAVGIPAWARSWQAELFDAGWLLPENPRGLGGRDASATELLAYTEELAARGVLRSVHYPGYGIVGPTLTEFGSAEQHQLVGPALRGDDIWCVGMSEPDAGSDLAALRTRARPVRDGFVIEGQKVWTSFAPWARFCLCYARTNMATPARSAMSVFIVDMASPGVEVRPLRQVTGTAEFAEVTFDGVEVPAAALVGGEGEGWRIALAALTFERRGLWLEWLSGLVCAYRALLGRERTRGWRPAVADELAALYEEVLSVFALGMAGFARRGDPGLGPHSLLKLAVSELAVDLMELAVRTGYPTSLSGPDDDPVLGLEALLRSLGDTIGGGTADMQRNAIAARLLPRDPTAAR